MTDTQVTEHDLQSLAEKLEAFSKGLTPGEHAALSAMIRLATAAAAAAEQPEVAGHLYDPFSTALIAEAHHRELLREAERARMVQQARAAQPDNRNIWNRLRQQVAETAGELWVPHRQTNQPSTNP